MGFKSNEDLEGPGSYIKGTGEGKTSWLYNDKGKWSHLHQAAGKDSVPRFKVKNVSFAKAKASVAKHWK